MFGPFLQIMNPFSEFGWNSRWFVEFQDFEARNNFQRIKWISARIKEFWMKCSNLDFFSCDFYGKKYGNFFFIPSLRPFGLVRSNYPECGANYFYFSPE